MIDPQEPYLTAPRLSSATLAALQEMLAAVQRDIASLDAVLGDEDHPFARDIRTELSRACNDVTRARELMGLPLAGIAEARRLRDRAAQHVTVAASMLQQAGAWEED